jgi:hypothetical protein
MIMALPVRTSPLSSPTPFANKTNIPLSCALDGSQRMSHSRPFRPRNSSSMAAGFRARSRQSATSISPIACGLRESQPPV